MSKAYHCLLLCFFLLFLTTDAWTQNLKNGHFIAKIAGINISYTIKGKGPVMIVGHPNSGKIGYELSLKPLENKFTIVYYDPRGTGESGTPDSLSQYSDAHLVNEIDLLREQLHVSKIWLFGHSDQSAIALQYAIDHPENTSGLILSGTQYIKSRESVIE